MSKPSTTSLLMKIEINSAVNLHAAMTVFMNDTRQLGHLNTDELAAFMEFYGRLNADVFAVLDAEEDEKDQMYG